MKENHDAEMIEIINNLPISDKPTLLLHSCCGPCSSAVLERLCPHFDVTLFFYNPNIMPIDEYAKRLQEQKKVIDILPFNVNLVEHNYDVKTFLDIVKGKETEAEGGERCNRCISLRLAETAKYAAQNQFDYFCTTLSVSPHKNASFINETGKKLSSEYAVSFLPSDFKKRNGYLRSTVFCKENNIYRQDYCGCIFSKSTESVASST